jgi:mono/diheme cytochrome c family protein
MEARPFPTVPGLRAAFQPAALIAVWCGGIFLVVALPAIARGDDAGDFFEEKVRPVLATRCLSCHSDSKQKAGLRLDSLVGMLRGGESGAALVPGEPDESNLVMAIRHDGWEMPPDGKLSDAEIEAIAEWVRRGAPWPGTKPAAELLAEGLPEDESEAEPLFGPPQRKQKSVITDADRSYWAYQPVRRPDVPPRPAGEGLRDGLLRAEIRSPVDAFILAKLAEQGVEPVAEADRETLARRLFFDLLGVPPEPADVASFVADPSPDAYDRLVDRLLADPRYGERQARHWLDLARYAESDGFRQDAFRPTAWRYRDWCIDAFNADMPFDRFVKAQLAADELFAADPAMAAATGFLRQTPYEYNQVDVETQRSEILNEVTDVTADVFLAMGMGCARCHDHKYDPILQRDYFALQAFFAPLVWKDDLALASAAAPVGAPSSAAARVADLRQELAAIREACRDPAAWGGFKRFPPTVQELIFKPVADRTPHEEQIVQLASRQLKFDAQKLPEAERLRYEAIEEELAALKTAGTLPPPAPTTLTVADVGPTPPPTTIPGKPAVGEIEPRVPTVLGGQALPAAPLRDEAGATLSTGRRAALAAWLASPDNPLTARVFVNRLWQWHFGSGLVGTASDFGVLGEQATHPELLDWLAAEFVASGWSVKHLHRLVVKSAAYRRGSRASAANLSAGPAADPQNRLLWRQNPRRLDAEQVRDAALAIAGDLDPRAAGPSTPPSKPRRAIYTTVIRNTRDDICDVFDGADAYSSCARRNATTTALQSLYLVNGEWMLARARSLALAIEQAGGHDDGAVAAEAIRRVTGREPGPERLAAAVAFLAEQRQRIDDAASTQSITVVQRMPQRAGLAAVIDPADPAAVLRAEGTGWPEGDFTIEAHVILQSLFADATVRTIAAQWTGIRSDPGWSLGVTSEKSKYKPRNLILQLSGEGASPGSGHIVVPSDIHLQLQRPYYVAASVKTSGGEQGRAVTFFVKDLSDNDAPLVVKSVPHAFAGSHASPRAFTIGGRDASQASGAAAHVWDGLIDDVRLSNRPLVQSELLWEDGDPGHAVVGHWIFEETPGFAADSSGQGRTLVRGLPPPTVRNLRRYEALVDLCHVLFNTSEFLYVE